MGSIIKVITGNLDESDAQNYDAAITSLIDSQNKTNSVVLEQTTLLQESITKFNSSIYKLAHNQVVLESRIMQIQQAFKEARSNNLQDFHYFLIQMIFTQIMQSFQTIYDQLEKIESAISFSKTNTFHNSIVEPNELLTEMSRIAKILVDNSRFPFEPILKNILLLESVISIKSYSNQNRINFVLEVPIVEKEIYNYFRLYPLPVFHENQLRLIIPQNFYLILNENNYATSSQRCHEILDNNFLCQENTLQIQDNPPCEIQLINYANDASACKSTSVTLSKTKVQKLEKDYWIVIATKRTILKRNCFGNKDNFRIFGSYVIKMVKNCEVEIDGNFLKIYDSYRTSVYPSIPEINIPGDIKLKIENLTFNPLKLDNIDIGEIKRIYHALEGQRTRLNNPVGATLHFNNISIWTIVLYVIVICAVAYVIGVCRQKLKAKNIRQDEPARTPRAMDIQL